METLLRGDLFPKVVEAYSRPTRIVRGKDVDPSIKVQPFLVFWLMANRHFTLYGLRSLKH